jgi:hypothetical protein
MARRKATKKPVTRRRKQALNLFNAAEALTQASVFTRGAFGTDLIPFLLEGWAIPATASRSMESTSMWGGSGGTQNSWGISLAELLNSAMGGMGGVDQRDISSFQGKNAFGMVAQNVKMNIVPMAIQTVGVGIGFRVLRKISAKPRRLANKGLKTIGLEKDVKV